MSSRSSASAGGSAKPLSDRKHCFRLKAYDFNVDRKYKINKVIGYGAYGVVASGENTETKEKIAIKKIPDVFRDLIDGKRVLREIRLLQHFNHENVISLKDVMRPLSRSKFREYYFVTEQMDTDLHRVIRSKQRLSEEHVQYFIYQILRGLKYIHSGEVVHRDLKPSNILVNANCDLKICDFGLARSTETSPVELTAYVVTRWYRAPELLLECGDYTKAIDVWSAGCILAELINRKPLLPGANYIDQLRRICRVIGTPSPDVIERMHGKRLPQEISMYDPQPWEAVCANASEAGLDLLSRMLKFDPAERITVDEALKHPYLSALHDPEDEPSSVPEMFDFSWDKDSMSEAELRSHLWDQALLFHPLDRPEDEEDDSEIPLVFTDGH